MHAEYEMSFSGLEQVSNRLFKIAFPCADSQYAPSVHKRGLDHVFDFSLFFVSQGAKMIFLPHVR
jgi:hypothetical protein